MSDTNKTKVYYNSACPVCRAGVNSQKEKMTACEIEWIDVHSDPAKATEVGADLEFVRERLHVVAPDGSKHVGAEAFSALWSQTRGQRWLARAARVPGLRTLFNWAYNVFARRLYRWNRKKGHW